MFKSAGVSLPALRGRQGDRTMYLTLPKNQVLNNFFPRDFEPIPAGAHSQRPYDPGRASAIGRYMAKNRRDYVLGALTYAIDQPGNFQEVEPGSDIGVLTVPLDARLRSTDGQHRRGGIKEALSECEELGDEHTALLIYVEPDLTKRRQMFSDMNWHQKPVSKSVNVGFDRRDPFARVTQRLVGKHRLLQGRVETERPSISAGSEKLYTQGTIYDALGRCVSGVGGRVRNRDRWDDREDELYTIGAGFFDLLISSRDELASIASGELQPAELRARSILGSGTTLRAIAGAYYLCLREGFTTADLAPGLHGINFSPKNRVWHRIGFVTPGKGTPNARLQEVKTAAQTIAKAMVPEGKGAPLADRGLT